jgi:ribosomal 30S subunit maturation factor RimM
VRGQEKPILIPFVKAICVEIDVPGRRIAVDLPDGLKDL